MKIRISSMIRSLLLLVAGSALLVATPWQPLDAATRKFIAADSSKQRVAIIDENGATEWEYPIGPLHDLTVLANGNVLFQDSWTHVIELERDSKKIVWQYDAMRSRDNEDRKIEIHAFLRLANGNTLIGTGNGHGVLEVTPAQEIVWSLRQNDLPDIQLAWVTTLQVLPSGNIVIGNCHAGPDNPQLIEVTRDKQVVWKFRDFERFGDSLTNSQILSVDGEAIK